MFKSFAPAESGSHIANGEGLDHDGHSGQEYGHQSSEHHISPLLMGDQVSKPPKSSKFKRFEHRLRRQRSLLSLIAVIMVTLNIIQACLINQLHNLWWVLAVPLGVFGFLMLLVAANVARNWNTVMATWRESTAERKIAQIGIALSVMLPIILCQFLYMPIVAVSDWHRISWTSDLRVQQQTLFPGVVVSVLFDDLINMRQALCRPEIFGSNVTECSVTPTVIDDNVLGSSYQYFIFNPSADHQSNGALTTNTVTTDSEVTLILPFTVNSTSGRLNQFSIGLFDPSLNLSLSGLRSLCGNPPRYHSIQATATNYTFIGITADTFYLNDKAKALQPSIPSDSCGEYTQNYTYYNAEVNVFAQGSSLTGSECDEAIGSNGTCTFVIQLQLSSSLVTTQTSRRETGTLKILIDEGSILGGILFFTWFFSIFIV